MERLLSKHQGPRTITRLWSIHKSHFLCNSSADPQASKQSSVPKAPSFEGASLVPATPPSGSHRGRVLVTVGVCLPDPMPSPTHGPLGSSLATPNSAWNFWLTEGHFLTGYGPSLRATASHLASIHASEAFPDRTGYNPAANTPDAVNRHIVNNPVCNDPVDCATIPTKVGPAANPNAENVTTKDDITATSRGLMSGNSKGRTFMAGVKTHAKPRPVIKNIRTTGSPERMIPTPNNALKRAGIPRRSFLFGIFFAKTPPSRAVGMRA